MSTRELSCVSLISVLMQLCMELELYVHLLMTVATHLSDALMCTAYVLHMCKVCDLYGHDEVHDLLCCYLTSCA